MWINAEELPFGEAGTHRKVACPKCDTALEALRPADDHSLVVDRCPKCLGFWLDQGELEQMKAVVATMDDKATARVEYASRPPNVSRLRWAAELVKAAFR